MEIIFSPEVLDFHAQGHPESPERVKKAHDALKSDYMLKKPEPAAYSDLELVHAPELITAIQNREFYEPDCPRHENIYHYARLAAGGAIAAQKKGGFSLMRPPGHHAGKNFLGGFCYFNNLAVAVKQSGLRTLIIDIDGHHGNGTQDIFSGDEQAAYISLHRHPCYPGTGLDSQDNIYNYPLAPECGEKLYLNTLHKALDEAADDDFEQVALSAGFDTHSSDPLASLGLKTKTYKAIGEMIKSLNLPVFAVLEGGYTPDHLGPNIAALISGLCS